ncbi:hypothetical protein GFS24_17675 [Chitinophaga sp. SYP-B3965]|uniref:caspase family protein n=1 Tax=Chitinophaga sp. SYP-B3965 TaxID=2663120 RepID=UPI00129A022F|nr:caspase family protein [Chitinophaga sp. SYP-B3965]MRG46956.1 hypothetical protein [Chitinophaga sp. SYP-B3965]
MKFSLLAFITVILTIVNGIAGKKDFGEEKGKKIALVIGVGNYQFIDPLGNSLHDAKNMDSVLTALGFEVVRLLDPSAKEFSRKIEAFGENMRNASTCLFYFAGHAAEIKGENFLFTRSFNPNKPSNPLVDAYPLQKLFAKCNTARIKTSIIILDAAGCRSNNKNYNKGLTGVTIPNSTFLVYATAPGTSGCENGRNGLLTNALLNNINQPDVSIDQLFNKVSKEVRNQTGDKQIPYRTSNLDNEYFFLKNNIGTVNSDTVEVSSPILRRSLTLHQDLPMQQRKNTFTFLHNPHKRI